ncbi:MAG TPA: class I SAM-dependent methyltransferase [Acidimicrobiales bacterium]|nr:class I SAM-dependent methyltransferase [Acidimicrobiales bacterium]
MGEPNAEMAVMWNGPSAERWLALDANHDRALAPWGDAVLAAAAPGTGERVLDVGCGTGAMTRSLARRVAGGTAQGVDISAPLVARARAKAQAEGVGNVSFTVADAQVHDFPPASVDVAVSRFGVMFFADPVAAFANIGRALAPGGRLAFACWQDEAANDWLRIPAEVLAEHVGHTEPVPGAPGAVSLADPERVRAMLGAAGFAGVAVADAPAPMWLGADAAEAYERVATSGMTRTALEGKDPAAVSAALDALRAAIAGLVRGEGVSVPARAWLVTARRA